MNKALHLPQLPDTARAAWLLPTMRGGYYWQPLFREFSKLFPHTVIFTSDWPGFITGCEGTFNVRTLAGYRHISLRRTHTDNDIGYDGYHWVTPTVIAELCRFRPDVLFTSAFGLWTACALVYKLVARCRVIILLDGISKTTAYMEVPLRMLTRRMMGSLVDAAVCNSRAGCDYLRDDIRIHGSKVIQCAFYVPDVTVLRSKTTKEISSESRSRPTFLFIGQIIERKGWKYLLDATELLVKKGFKEFSVNVVGDGQERELLCERILSGGLQSVVNVVGAVPYDCIGAYFESGDVLILPSLEDTWGMVLSEAMAFGKAVLCSQFVGARELVQNGKNGYIFNPRNPSELAGHMEQFLCDPELIVKFGARSQEIIASHTPQCAAENLGRVACMRFGRPDGARSAVS